MSAKLNIIGRRFGRFIVRSEGPAQTSPCGTVFRTSVCDCACGEVRVVRNNSLLTGNSKSCGCLKREVTSAAKRTHGHTRNKISSRTYQAWAGMLQRCTNPKAEQFADYGGRGITFCQGVRRFEDFLALLGECPPKREIHRVNNDGNYSCGKCQQCLTSSWPMNCVWETRKVQMRHTRWNKVLTVRGTTACLAELCELFKVPYNRTKRRLALGWNAERAFFTPQLHVRA